MISHAKVKRVATISVLLLLAQFFFPASAEACPLCQDQLSQSQQLAFSVSALFMLSMPFILMGFIGTQLMRALNPEGYQQAHDRIVGFVRPKLVYAAVGLVVVPLLYIALSPAAPPQTRLLPRAQLVSKVNFTGKSIETAQLDNKVVVVNFFASWCESCKAEVADLGELYRTNAPDIEIIGIAFDFEHQNEPAAQPHIHPDGVVHYHALPNALQMLLTFLQTNHAAYAVIPYTPEIAESFGEIRAIPTTFLFDRRGQLSKSYVGPPSLATLKADVQKLLEQN